MNRYLELVIGAILLLLSQITEQTTTQAVQIHPLQYAFANNTVAHSDKHCERYSRGILRGINTTQYFYCNHPGQLTDSDLGPEQFNPNDATEVYIWPPGENNLLFTFSPPPLNISTIVLYYYRSSAGKGRPKTRFCAVSTNHEIWNATTFGDRCRAENEMRPGQMTCAGACRERISIAFNYFTDKVLMQIEDSKNFEFVVSEIEFYAIENTTTEEQTTETKPTTNLTTPTLGSTTYQVDTQTKETTKPDIFPIEDGETGIHQLKTSTLILAAVFTVTLLIFLS